MKLNIFNMKYLDDLKVDRSSKLRSIKGLENLVRSILSSLLECIDKLELEKMYK